MEKLTENQEKKLNEFIESQYINVDRAAALVNIIKEALFDDSGCFSKNVKASDIDCSLTMVQELLDPVFISLVEARGFPNEIFNEQNSTTK